MRTMNAQYITDQKGNKNAIILPIDEYNELIEDIHDLAVIAERKDQKILSLEEIKKRLK